MGIIMKKLIVFLIVFALIMSATPVVAAAEPTDIDIISDVLIVRPVSIVATVVGSVVFVVALPFSIPSGSVGVVGQRLVADPFNYTFVRTVGVY